MYSDWEDNKLLILVGLEEVVHEVGVEEGLDAARDEGGPHHERPPEDPT